MSPEPVKNEGFCKIRGNLCIYQEAEKRFLKKDIPEHSTDQLEGLICTSNKDLIKDLIQFYGVSAIPGK